MIRGFVLTTFIAIFMISSCENPTCIEQIELKDTSYSNENAQTNLNDIKQIYRYKCSICHGKNGVSIIKDTPDLVSTEFTIEERVAIIVYGKGTMPPQKDVLDMPTIRGLAVYIDSLKYRN